MSQMVMVMFDRSPLELAAVLRTLLPASPRHSRPMYSGMLTVHGLVLVLPFP
jgi:hypothetical protein